MPDRAQQAAADEESGLHRPVVSGAHRVKCKYQSSLLFVSMVCSKTQDEHLLQSTRIKERRLALGKLNLLVKRMGIHQTVCWSMQGQSSAHRSVGSAQGMKGAVCWKASVHRSHCDDLTTGIYAAFKYINMRAVNNRKRGYFTFMCSIAKTRSQIAKCCVQFSAFSWLQSKTYCFPPLLTFLGLTALFD